MLKAQVDIFTDGACKGNPGPGGWGVILKYKEIEKELWGGAIDTTNNRMELQAVIEGLTSLKYACIVTVTTDSKYVINGITKWIKEWKVKKWQRGKNKPVKNKDLWILLDQVSQEHEITWCWVKGHTGHKYNERADALANYGVEEKVKQLLS